jgi:RnfABCDGE-type electron transport complex B subunit
MTILSTILVLSALGMIFGAALALAAKKFCVATDPRIEKVFAKLPGANCGACGLPGCMGFAEGLIKGKCDIGGCSVSSEAIRKEIAHLLGKEFKKIEKRLAVLHCGGGENRAKDKMVYSGIKECKAANLTMGGQKKCFFGCLGFGDCVKACPFGAISMDEENLPVVNENKCTACAKCVAACPKALFSLAAASKNYAVRCKSRDLGKTVLEACSVGCIACHKCIKACPVGAIKVIDNLATIDYNICDNRGECFKVCPTKCIAKKENKVFVSRQ